MNAPMVWILFPMILAGLLIALRKWQMLVNLLGTGFSLLLAVLGLVIPINLVAEPGMFQFSLAGDWTILGRVFSISQLEMPFISFLYLMVGIWFVLSWESKQSSLFIPIGLGVTAVLIAALAVRPFIYGALLIEAAVMGCMLMLIEKPKPVGRGVIRFLILQSLGMPFILLAGWFLASGEITPINQTQLTLSVVLLVLGFAFWIGLFPLHTWIHMVAEEAEPRVAGFIFSILPLPVIFFLMSFMNSFAWLREYPLLFPVLRWLGSFMVVFAGVWLFFQKQLKTSLGYLVIALNGLALLSLGIKGFSGITLLTYFFLPRFLSILLFVITLVWFEKRENSNEGEILAGLAGRVPFITWSLMLAFFSISGLPFLPGFPFVQMVVKELVNLSYLALIMFLTGMLFFFLNGLRLLVLVYSKTSELEKEEEPVLFKGAIVIAVFILLFSGLFPNMASSVLLNLADKFLLLMR